MDKWLDDVVLKVKEVSDTVTLTRNTSDYRFRVVEPNHTCANLSPLRVGDIVRVKRRAANNDLLVEGPCGCDFLLYDVVV